MLKIKDIMNTILVVSRPEMHIYDAIRLLMKRNLQSLPVVDADLHLVGMISENEALRELHDFPEEDDRTVGETLNANFKTLDPEADVEQAHNYLLEHTDAPLAAVTNERGQLVGTITRKKLIKNILVSNRRKELSV